MERKRQSTRSCLTWFTLLLVGVLSQNLVIPVMCSTTTTTINEEEKNYYNSPNPHHNSPPTTMPSSSSPFPFNGASIHQIGVAEDLLCSIFCGGGDDDEDDDSSPGSNGRRSSAQQLSFSKTRSRSDGVEALYREGTASFLNSMVNNSFPYTTQQVRDKFVASLASDKAAAAQANLFRIANEGRA